MKPRVDPHAKPNAKGKERRENDAPFTIVGAGAKRAPQPEQPTPPPAAPASPTKTPVQEKPARPAFRERVVGRKSVPLTKDSLVAREANAEAEGYPEKSPTDRRAQIKRIWPRLLRRGVYRFHAQFSVAQILGFYVGIPALVSLIACAYVMTRPKAEIVVVTPIVESSGSLVNQVVAALKAEDKPAAEKIAARLVAEYPDDAKSHVASAAALAALEKLGEARSALQRAMEIAPGNLPARMNLAEIEFADGRYAEAIEHYERLPKNVPNSAIVAFRLYICYLKTGREDEAGALLRSGQIRSQSAEDYFVRVAQATARGDHSEASRLARTAELLFEERSKAYSKSLKKAGLLK